MNLLVVRWNVDPAIFRIGGFELRYYSLLFVGGFILGWFMMKSFFKREKVSERLLDPMLYMLLICTIVGARLGHCLFYQPDYYLGSWAGFWEIFMPWKGGLASHGGALAILLGIWWYAHKYGRKNGFDYIWVLDHLVIPTSFAGACIRLGNLFNSEIYGGPTDLPWGFIFLRNGETVPCHPTQLYEASCYLLLGLLLLWLYWKKADKIHRGAITGLFFIGCFGSRFIIEYIKNPQVEFEKYMTLDMGQLLSIPFILAGIAFLVYAHVSGKPLLAEVPAPTPKKPKEPTHYAHSADK